MFITKEINGKTKQTSIKIKKKPHRNQFFHPSYLNNKKVSGIKYRCGTYLGNNTCKLTGNGCVNSVI